MKILIADDEKNIRESLKRLFELEGIESVTAADGGEAKARLEAETFDLALLDLKMPVLSGQDLAEWIAAEGFLVPVVLISAHGEIQDAVKALKAGARDFIEKPFDSAALIALVRRTAEEERRRKYLEAESRTSPRANKFIGGSASAVRIRRIIEKVADTDATVLITGESGTGKEIAAREIHDASPRRNEPFVAVNIGAVPESLIESELFGHEKGAFTSADSRRIGLFELAGSGTLFLDEIGDMPLSLQVKLLRVLQERKVRRLGGVRDIPVRMRIISATNRDLEERVRLGTFREDLYYRLNVVRIPIPPLRERRSDIPLLAEFLLANIIMRLNTGHLRLSDEAARKLEKYSFPGNVRELENILERAAIFAGEGVIRQEHIEVRLPDEPGAGESRAPESKDLKGVERESIVAALRKRKGNRTRAAEDLGISRRSIIYKIKEYKIPD